MEKQKEKVLEIEMEDGSHWQVPLHCVAHHCGKYHAEEAAKGAGDPLETALVKHKEVYLKRYNELHGSEDHAVEWFTHHVKLEEMEEHAVHVSPAVPSFICSVVEDVYITERDNGFQISTHV